MHTAREPGTVLLVEDDADDALLIRRALRRSGLVHDVVHANDAAEAVERTRELAASLRLVLLDLDLRGPHGLAVLRRLRADPALFTVPVVVFSGSQDERDVRRGYELGANAFVRKPVDATRFAETVDRLARFWLESNVPARPPADRDEVAP